jgi:hypothetical protein
MAGCEERFVPECSGGYHETTWGIALHIGDAPPLVLTWGESGSAGDPFYLEAAEPDQFKRIDSLELHDVSAVPPWDRYVGESLRRFSVLTYRTNHPGSGFFADDKGAWRSLPWGVELDLGRPLLIGALHHGDFLNYTTCADEVVVAYDADLINEIKAARTELETGSE